jgi:hypothetical protein
MLLRIQGSVGPSFHQNRIETAGTAPGRVSAEPTPRRFREPFPLARREAGIHGDAFMFPRASAAAMSGEAGMHGETFPAGVRNPSLSAASSGPLRASGGCPFVVPDRVRPACDPARFDFHENQRSVQIGDNIQLQPAPRSGRTPIAVENTESVPFKQGGCGFLTRPAQRKVRALVPFPARASGGRAALCRHFRRSLFFASYSDSVPLCFNPQRTPSADRIRPGRQALRTAAGGVSKTKTTFFAMLSSHFKRNEATL